MSWCAPTEHELIAQCEAVWQAYLSGGLDEDPSRRPLTLGELVTAFCERDSLSRATRGSYRRALDLLSAHAGADLPLVALGSRVVSSWLDSLTCEATSRRTYLRTVRAMVRHALANGWVTQDATEGLRVEAERHLRPWLRHTDWAAFLAACWPGHRIRAGFVLETGLRAGEVMAARWSWIHQVDGRPAIRIAPDGDFTPKWGQSRAVPLSAKAQGWLEEARKRWPKGDRIFSEEGLQSANFARENRDACLRAKLLPVDFHGLRRSAGARWLEVGMPVHVVSRLLGHQDITTTMRWYGGVADAHLAREMDRVDEAAKPNVGGGQKRFSGGGSRTAAVPRAGGRLRIVT